MKIIKYKKFIKSGSWNWIFFYNSSDRFFPTPYRFICYDKFCNIISDNALFENSNNNVEYSTNKGFFLQKRINAYKTIEIQFDKYCDVICNNSI